MNFLPVTAGSVISKYAGESARAIDEAFAAAVANAPCVLFFDEFDSLASRRDSEPDAEHRRVVNQLLTALEQHHASDHVVVIAATNDLTRLDPAVTRPGRFDRTIRIDLPDAPTRRAILATALAGRPVSPAIDLATIAERTAGRTAADLTALVDTAAGAAFAEHTEAAATRNPAESVPPVLIDDRHLTAALTANAGQDRPYLGDHRWEDLVLPPAVLAELRAVQKLIERPDLATRYGVRPLSGLLLAGPPGTGKTSVARTLAAQARVSFYPLSTADLTSPWVGQAEQHLAQLFERARAAAPSVVFIDEIDAIAADRDSLGGFLGDRLLTQLLAELDGIATTTRPVFVLAATNRPEALDPALVRGGRLSRTLRLPLPDRAARLQLLALHGRDVPLAPDVDLAALADATAHHSGADLAGLLQQAALHALVRHDGATPVVAQADLLSALAALPRTCAPC
ncbi:AAA family ATPase [Kitasatospora sp. NBC_01302]|uniref:AAA family ATPase n=1 Tax=Kitasatospora sp. NBC_01302 TaxID=2903575 RepID=UPI002E142590|nr:AAA family ATPase [Kitasatospora sp. NBC_01302]